MANSFTPEQLQALASVGIYHNADGSVASAPQQPQGLTPQEVQALQSEGINPSSQGPGFMGDVGIGVNSAARSLDEIANNVSGDYDYYINGNKQGIANASNNNKIEEQLWNSKLNQQQLNALQQPGINAAKVSALAGAFLPAGVATIASDGVLGEVAAGAGLGELGSEVLGSLGGGAVQGAISQGQTASDVYQQKMQELAKQGVTGPDAVQQATDAATTAGLESGAVNSLAGMASLGTGKALGSVMQSPIKAGLASAVTDAGVNGALGGPIQEQIESSNAGRDFNTQNAIDNAMAGALAGGVLGGFSGVAKGREYSSIREATDAQYQNHDINGPILTKNGAEKRANMLNNGVTSGNQFEVLPAIGTDGLTEVPNKFVVAQRNQDATAERPDLLSQTPVSENVTSFDKADTAQVQQQADLANNKPVESAVASEDSQAVPMANAPADETNPIETAINPAKDAETVTNNPNEDTGIVDEQGNPVTQGDIDNLGKEPAMVDAEEKPVESADTEATTNPDEQTSEPATEQAPEATTDQSQATTTEPVQVPDINQENKIPPLGTKEQKLNDGITKVISDDSGNPLGYEIKGSIRRPANYDTINNGNDHTGNPVTMMQDLFTKGYKDVQLVRDKTNPVDKNAFRVLVDGKTAGMLGKDTAKVLAPIYDSGHIQAFKAHIEGEHMPYSAKTSADTRIHSVNNEKYRPILKIQAVTKDGMSSTHPELKRMMSSDFIDEMASKAIGKDVTEMSDEDLHNAYKMKQQEFKDKVEKPLTEQLQALHAQRNEKIDLVMQHTDGSFSGDAKDSIQDHVTPDELNKNFGLFFVNPDTGKPTAYVNINLIQKAFNADNSMLSGLKTLKDAVSFIYAHEAMGHGGMRLFFKSQKDFDNAMIETHNSSQIIRDAVQEKYKLGYNDDVTDLAGRVEEVMGDLAGGHVYLPDENGNITYQSAREFLSKYQDKPGMLAEFLQAFKQLINRMVGKDIFSIDKTYSLDDVKGFQKALDDIEMMSKSTENSPWVKSKNDFMQNPNVTDDMKMYSIKFAKNADKALDSDYVMPMKDRVLNYMKATQGLFSKGNNLRMNYSRVQSDPELKYGWNFIEQYETDTKKFGRFLSRPLEAFFKVNKDLTPDEKSTANRIILQYEKAGKPISPDDMNGQALSQPVKDYLTAFEKTRQSIIEERAKAQMLADSIREGALTDGNDIANYNHYRKLENFSLDEMKNQLTSMARANMGDQAEDFIRNRINRTSDTAKSDTSSGVIPRAIIGDHFTTVRDANGKLMQLNFHNSAFDRNRKFNDLSTQFNGKDYKIEKGEFPNQDNEMAREDSLTNTLLNEARQNNIPMDVYRNIAKVIDSTSKGISKNVNVTPLNVYTRKLGQTVDGAEKANLLNKIYANATKPNNQVLGKIKALNALGSLGLSFNAATTTAMGVPMNTDPFLLMHGGRYDATAAMPVAMKLATMMKFGKFDDTELPEYLANHSYFSSIADKELLKNTITELQKDGMLETHSSFNTSRLANTGFADGYNGDNTAMKLWNKAGNGLDFATKVGTMPFGIAEGAARIASTMAALRVGADQGRVLKISDMDGLARFAKDTVYQTQGYYGKAGRPMWATSPIGQMLFQFKNFMMTTVELMARTMMNQPNKGAGWLKRATPAAAMIGSYILASGLNGLPFVEDANNIGNTVAKWLGYKGFNFADQSRELIKDLVGDNKMAQWLTYGGLSDYGAPFNLASRLGVEHLIPASDFFDETNQDKKSSLMELLGPTGTNLNRIATSIDDLSKGVGWRNTLLDGLPSGPKSLFQGIDAYQRGAFYNNKGQKIMDASTSDAIYKAFGFDPSGLAQTNRLLEQTSANADNIKNMKDIIYNKMARAVVNNDSDLRQEAIQQMRDFNAENPTETLRFNPKEVSNLVKQMKVDKLLREERTAPKELRGSVAREVADLRSGS